MQLVPEVDPDTLVNGGNDGVGNFAYGFVQGLGAGLYDNTAGAAIALNDARRGIAEALGYYISRLTYGADELQQLAGEVSPIEKIQGALGPLVDFAWAFTKSSVDKRVDLVGDLLAGDFSAALATAVEPTPETQMVMTLAAELFEASHTKNLIVTQAFRRRVCELDDRFLWHPITPVDDDGNVINL